MMTFEEFCGTARDCDNLATVIGDARWNDDPVPGQGKVYLDALYIEKVLPHWPATARARGRWYLCIGRSEWITDDLTSLERILYDWACGEGYCNAVI